MTIERDRPPHPPERGDNGFGMNKIAKVTWLSVAILIAIVLIAFLATRGGQ